MAHKVDTVHPDYTKFSEQWERESDCYDGGDAVKNKGQLYLPRLESHKKEGGAERYMAYRKRALFYNATARTVDGLAGAVFQKEPKIEASPQIESHWNDVTLQGVSAELAMLYAVRRVLLQGRYGILVDWADDRPFWQAYQAPQITDWAVEQIDGRPTLVMVTLKEEFEKDADTRTSEVQYRTLELNRSQAGGSLVYVNRVHRKIDNTWKVVDEKIPVRRGAALDFIPFVFFGSSNTDPDVERSPSIDLVDVNLSHYRTSADLEHGLHFVGTPQLVVIGGINPQGKPLAFGSGSAILLPIGGDAKILQADGELLGALERADERKRKMMAVLGAKLLEEQPAGNETATAVQLRHAGEHATLRTVANAIERGFSDLVRIHEWWAGFGVIEPDKSKARVELNKDFFAIKMDAQTLQAWVAALQAEAISFETFWQGLIDGEWARPGVTAEEEKKQIEEEAPPEPDMMIGPLGQPIPANTLPGSPEFAKAAKEVEKDLDDEKK
jgi:hypothetical protein